MPIVGAGNPAPGSGTTINYMGGRIWAGWSGLVNAINGANGTLFNFRSPDIPLTVTASFCINASALSANKVVGVIVKMDGIVIYEQIIFEGEQQPDFDVFYFVIPGGSLINIECKTSNASNLPMALTLVCKQIRD